MVEKNRSTKHEKQTRWTGHILAPGQKIPLKKGTFRRSFIFFVPICLGFSVAKLKPFFQNERSCSHENPIVNRAIIRPHL